MKNKNGFTLIELLAVIAIIALISLIAIPNIVGLSDGIRKDNMLDDAKKLISMAKYQVNKNYGIRVSASHKFYFNELNINGDIKSDPDGGEYDKAKSYVRYTNDGSEVSYCIYLLASKRVIKYDVNSGGCVPEDKLYSRSKVFDRSSVDDN